MSWEVQPFKAFGKIKFGDSLEDVCQNFGDNFMVINRTLTSKTSVCHFDDSSFFIHLDEKEKVSEIGVHDPEKACFQGIQLLNRDMYELQKELQEVGYEFQFVDLNDCLIHIELGIGISMYEGITKTVEVFNTRMHWYEDKS